MLNQGILKVLRERRAFRLLYAVEYSRKSQGSIRWLADSLGEQFLRYSVQRL